MARRKLQSLFKGEVVYDTDAKLRSIGFGRKFMDTVRVDGVDYALSSCPPPADHDPRGYSREMSELDVIPRSDWTPALKEQIEQKRRTSDYQRFPAHAQTGPTCWANGPAHAATTCRAIQGLAVDFGTGEGVMSANSVSVPISGGVSGGYEGSALKYSHDHGWVSCKFFPNGSKDRSLLDSAPCAADRLNNKALEWVDIGSDFEKFATACLLNWPIAVAYNGWSHVVMICDLVEIESGHFGLRIRNNWGESFGVKNEYGFGGYAVFPEAGGPHGKQSSGYALRQQTPSTLAA